MHELLKIGVKKKIAFIICAPCVSIISDYHTSDSRTESVETGSESHKL